VLDNDGPIGVSFDQFFEVDNVAFDMLKYGSVYLRIVAGNEFSAFSHLAATATAGSGFEFARHVVAPMMICSRYYTPGITRGNPWMTPGVYIC
jgi:hypothetical protein